MHVYVNVACIHVSNQCLHEWMHACICKMYMYVGWHAWVYVCMNCGIKMGKACCCGEIHVFISHRLQQALGVLLCLVVVLFYVWQCTVQYWLSLSWSRFMYEFQAECRSLHNLGRSQSAWFWASWHRDLNISGDRVIITISSVLRY